MSPAPVGPAGNWTLTKDDEFNGTKLDPTLWSVGEPWATAPGETMGGTGMCPVPTPAGLVTESGGALNLNAVHSTVAGRDTNTCFVTTRNKYSFTHGYLEAKVKLPSSPGLWPAFWLLGNGTGSSGWPGTGEVDMFEFVNNGSENGTPFFTVHYAGPCDQWSHCQKTQDSPYPAAVSNFASRWVTYGIERTSTSLTIYIDGQRKQTFTNTMTNAQGQRLPAVLFDSPMHVRFDLSSGGWAQDPHSATQPGTFSVDYMRAWQPSGSSTAAAPVSTPVTTPVTSPPVPAPSTCPSAFSDAFTSSTLDKSVWTDVSSGITSGAGRLSVPASLTYRAASTGQRLCMTNGQASVQSIAAPSTSDAESDLVVGKDMANDAAVVRTGNTLIFRHTVNGTTSDTSAGFNAATDKFWRVRSSSGTISWQTSADGSTWTTRRAQASPLDLSHALVMLRAGAWTTAGTGTAVFGPVRVGPSS